MECRKYLQKKALTDSKNQKDNKIQMEYGRELPDIVLCNFLLTNFYFVDKEVFFEIAYEYYNPV